jgi:anti-sigma factor RsiW
MSKQIDEALVAYLDGELDAAERREIAARIEADPELRDRLAALEGSADLLRSAYADIVDEPVPERLIAAARGESAAAPETPRDAQILFFKRPQRAFARVAINRRQIGLAAAAALFGLMIGSAGTFVGIRAVGGLGSNTASQLALATSGSWLDNAAGNFKLIVNAGDQIPMDIPASNDPREAVQKISQDLPQQVKLPDLKPWGLSFRGARLVVVEGRPAAELVYNTDNKAIGPLTLVLGTTKQPDILLTFDRRQDVNMLYWRHQGRSYALVGQTDNGYLWGIANDIAWQLNAL